MSSYLKWSSGSWAILSNVFYLEEQTEADPLIVLMVSSLIGIKRFVHTWMSDIKADTFPECAGDCVCGVDPTERVEDVLWNVFGVDAVNGITHILFGRNYEREGEHARGRHTVV